MIELIEIEIKQGINVKLNAIVFYNENEIYLNNKKYQITDEFKKKLLRILSTWKSQSKNTNKIDEEEYKITIRTKANEEVIKGKGSYPHNYNELFRLLGELENE